MSVEAFPPGEPYYPPPGGSSSTTAATTGSGARPEIAYAPASVVAGQLVARLGPPSPGYAWEVRRITVQASDAASYPTAYVYVGLDTNPANLVCGTASGAFDDNDTNTPVWVPEGAQLIVAWSTATGTAGVRIEYTEV